MTACAAAVVAMLGGVTPNQLSQLAGGVYEVQRNAASASFLNVPLAPADDLNTPCKICVGHS